MVAAFILSLLVFVAIGAASVLRSRGTTGDYLLASRDVPPGLAALSSVATNNSGYMFIGLIGFAYTDGLAAVWLQLGWVVGDLIAWSWFHRRLREVSGETDAATLSELVASSRSVRVLTAVLAIVLMVTYAAAQLKAGSKALHVLLDWDLSVGAVVGALIVVIYSYAGGIRASIWTDAAQAAVMLLAMVVMIGAVLSATGGFSGLVEGLDETDPKLLQVVPDDLGFGFFAWFVGFVFGGLGVIGQPHILVRTMAMRSPDDIPKARRVYFSWYVPFSICAVLVGLGARMLLPDTAAFDPELALPTMAVELLPGVVVGVILAGLFAATMSTADSLVIACSASLTRDIAPRFERFAKLGTLTATAIALALALYGPDSVFVLVLIAWSALATAFGPLLLLRLLGLRVAPALAWLVILAGLGTAMCWRFVWELQGDLYEILPGFAAGLLAYGLGRLLRPQRDRP